MQMIANLNKEECILIRKKVWDFLEKEHREVLDINYEACRPGEEYDEDLWEVRAFLLGGKKNKISEIVTVKNMLGCGLMCEIPIGEMNRGIYQLATKNLDLLGIARLGAFNPYNKHYRGIAWDELRGISKGKLFMLSMGRDNETIIHRYIGNYKDEYLNYKIMEK